MAQIVLSDFWKLCALLALKYEHDVIPELCSFLNKKTHMIPLTCSNQFL